MGVLLSKPNTDKEFEEDISGPIKYAACSMQVSLFPFLPTAVVFVCCSCHAPAHSSMQRPKHVKPSRFRSFILKFLFSPGWFRPKAFTTFAHVRMQGNATSIHAYVPDHLRSCACYSDEMW
jgi:hypothetical protein